jgi:predicted acylesterase/phospholipase RssA
MTREVKHRADLDAGRKETDEIRILSLDGGGMRGIIPARILVELERLSGRPVAGLFDVIAGTSTGGMIALALSKPGPGGKPAMTAQEILDTYITYGPQVFPKIQLRPLGWRQVVASRPIVMQRLGAMARPRRYGNARYRALGLESLFDTLMGDTMLEEAMADVIVPCYDWKAGRAVVFRSREIREGSSPNVRMALVARATSAAPTYFSPVRLRTKDREYILIDGGVVANNPASIAYYEALYQARSTGREHPDFLVVSLGTGRPPEEVPTYQELWSRSWLRMGMGMLGVMFDGTSEIVDELLAGIIKPSEPTSRYWRLNGDLRGARLNLDDASSSQVRILLDLAEGLIEEQRPALADMVKLLMNPGSGGSRSPRTRASARGSGSRSAESPPTRSKG